MIDGNAPSMCVLELLAFLCFCQPEFRFCKIHFLFGNRSPLTLASGFSMKKRGNRSIEHNTLPWLGGSATLSVTDRCRDGAVIDYHVLRDSRVLVKIAHIRRFLWRWLPTGGTLTVLGIGLNWRWPISCRNRDASIGVHHEHLLHHRRHRRRSLCRRLFRAARLNKRKTRYVYWVKPQSFCKMSH